MVLNLIATDLCSGTDVSSQCKIIPSLTISSLGLTDKLKMTDDFSQCEITMMALTT